MEKRNYARLAFLAVFLFVLYYVFRILQPFLSALIWAAILSTASYPLFRWLSKKLRRPRLASVLTCVFLTFVIVVPMFLLLIVLAGQSVEAYRFVEGKIREGELGQLNTLRERPAYQWLESHLTALGVPEPDLKASAVRALRSVSQFLVSHSSNVFSGFAGFVVNFFVMLFTMYYLFLRGPDVLLELRRLSPLRAEVEDAIISKFQDVTVATIQVTFVTALVQGAVGGLVFFLFGIPAPILWGAVMSFLALLPLIGMALVWGPAAIYYVLTGAVGKGILLAAIFIAVVGSIDNILRPVLLRHRAQVSTLWIFLAVLGGVSVFGFLGLVLGPLVVAVLFALIEIYKGEFRDELSEKLTPGS
jgi:predicted PurR-regulated permease PerM